MRRYNARFEYDERGNRIHLANRSGKWVRYEDVKPRLTAAERLLALVEAVAVDLDPEYGPDSELLAELPELKAKILANDTARVYGKVEVFDTARVYGKAELFGTPENPCRVILPEGCRVESSE